MALEVYQGAFSARTSTGTTAVRGVGFEPKALVFFTPGRSVSPGVHILGGLGFAAKNISGTINSVGMAYSQNDGSDPTQVYTVTRSERAVIVLAPNAATHRKSAYVSAMVSDGFDLTYSTADTNSVRIMFLALGGSDIEGADAISLLGPGSAGVQAYSVNTGSAPTLLLMSGVGSPSLSTTASSTADAAPYFGAATSSTERRVTNMRSLDAVGTTDEEHIMRNDMVSYDVQDQGDLDSFSAGSFSIDWTTSADNAHIALALRGPQAKLVDIVAPTVDGDSAVTGAGFGPFAALIAGSARATAYNTTAAQGHFSFGGAAAGSPAAGAGYGIAADDALGAANVGEAHSESSVIVAAEFSGTGLRETASIASWDSDGITLTWDKGSSSGANRYFAVLFGANLSVSEAGAIASEEAFGSPNVITGFVPDGIESAEAFGTPNVVGPVTMTAGIGTGEAFGIPVFSGGLGTPPPTPQAHWRIVLHKLSGEPVGEVLDARDRAIEWRLNRAGTVQFKVNVVSPQSANLLANKEGYLLVYQDNVLVMTAEVTSIQTAGSEGEHSIAVVGTETMWARLPMRLVGKSVAGLVGPTTATDQGTWLRARLDELNTENNTTIAKGSLTASANITGGGPWRYMPFMELIQYLSASIAGFDFWQSPENPARVAGTTGYLNIAPIRGTAKQHAVFEYGMNSVNAREYGYVVDTSKLMTRGFVLPGGSADELAGLVVVSSSDSAAITARGLREEVLQVDLTNELLRQQYSDEAVGLRKQPRELFTIQPAVADDTGRIPVFKRDYDVGDVVRGRVKDQGIILLDALVRIYGVKVEIGDEGQERVTLTLVDES